MKRERIRKNKLTIITNMISGILASAMILGVMVFSPAASAGTYNGLEYSVENGEVTITGFTGADDVTIPSQIGGYPVTRIGDRAFLYKPSLTSLVIPDSVKTIGELSFSLCKNLKSVTIGNGVTDIGLCAFSEAEALTYLKLGNNLKKIGDMAFSKCSLLTEVDIPDSVESIGKNAFCACPSLKIMKIGEGVKNIGSGAFGDCPSLNELTLNSGNKSFVIIDKVLYNKDVTTLIWCPSTKATVDIPDSVTAILDSAFIRCAKITKLTLPEDLKTIGYSAFYDCALIELYIPDNITDIADCAFASCKSLRSVKLGNGISKITAALFQGCSSLETLIIPNGVTSIEDSALEECSSLKSVTIPGSVTSMGTDVFKNCAALDDIYFGGTRAEWDAISTDASVPNNTTVHCSDGIQVSFIDVTPGAFYEKAVRWAVEKNITAGTSKTTFSPDDGCTRGQVVTFLWRAAGEPEPESDRNPFSDVESNDYFYKAVLWAVEKNITKGTSTTRFSPSEVCTRGQIVTFLWRTSGELKTDTAENPFDDVIKTDFFYSAVLWALEKGITKGTSNNSFSPTDKCTRGQVVTFLFRDSN